MGCCCLNGWTSGRGGGIARCWWFAHLLLLCRLCLRCLCVFNLLLCSAYRYGMVEHRWLSSLTCFRPWLRYLFVRLNRVFSAGICMVERHPMKLLFRRLLRWKEARIQILEQFLFGRVWCVANGCSSIIIASLWVKGCVFLKWKRIISNLLQQVGTAAQLMIGLVTGLFIAISLFHQTYLLILELFSVNGGTLSLFFDASPTVLHNTTRHCCKEGCYLFWRLVVLNSIGRAACIVVIVFASWMARVAVLRVNMLLLLRLWT